MFHPRVVALMVLFVMAATGYGRTFTRCELAKELLKQGFPKDQIPNWVCLIESEAGMQRNTAVIGYNNNKSKDYGLFQINNGFWCSEDMTPGKDCKIRCKDLINDNITDDSTCAKFIFRRHGYEAWNGWKKNCRNTKNLPDVSKCY